MAAEVFDPATLLDAIRVVSRSLDGRQAVETATLLARVVAHLRSVPPGAFTPDRRACIAFAERMGAAVGGGLPAAADHHARPHVSRNLEKLRKLCSAAEELASDVCDALDPSHATDEPPTSASAPATTDHRKGTVRFPDPVLTELAEHGVKWVTIDMLTTRQALVHIESGNPFHLGPVLAHLLRIITSVGAPSDDDFEPFQSLTTVAARLGALTGRTYDPHHITAYVNRLRTLIQTKGKVNPMMIQTCPKRGVRFRVRRRPS